MSFEVIKRKRMDDGFRVRLMRMRSRETFKGLLVRLGRVAR
jgi:hypothetical protein